MIFISSLWSNQLIKGQQIRNWIKKARLDWNWSSFEDLIFCKKIKFDYHWLLINSFPKPFQIHPVLIPNAYLSRKREKIAPRTLFSNWKNRGKQASGNPISSHSQSFLRCPTGSLTSPEANQTFTLHKSIQNREISVWFVLENLKFDSSYLCIINLFWLFVCV